MDSKTNNGPHVELMAFVLDRAQEQPPRKRARLYRALGQISGIPAEREALERLANELEKADGLCCEFILSFTQTTSH